MLILACDLSMRCPGFAVLDYDERKQTVTLVEKSCVNNKNNYEKKHGQILA